MAWDSEHLPPDSPHFSLFLDVEHRFILAGIRDDGLVVRSSAMGADFQLICQTTIFLLEPLTEAARAEDHHVPANVTRFGPAVVIDPHCIVDIRLGISTAGLNRSGLAMTPKAADTRYKLHVVSFSVMHEPAPSVPRPSSPSRRTLKEPAAVASLARQIIADDAKAHFWTLMLDSQNGREGATIVELRSPSTGWPQPQAIEKAVSTSCALTRIRRDG